MLQLVLNYSSLILKLTGKKTFAAMGRIIKKSGDTISRMLRPAAESRAILEKLARDFFAAENNLLIAIDDTLLRKVHSSIMCGSGWFYDTKIGRKVRAYKLLVYCVTNGVYAMPLGCEFLYDAESYGGKYPVIPIVKKMIANALDVFPDKKITVVADGAFASVELLRWCFEMGIRATFRMHSNRKITFERRVRKDRRTTKEVLSLPINKIDELLPQGRQKARTIKATWHDLQVYITADRRIDKHGDESIVYLVSTYRDRPSVHVKNYKKRWVIEKFFRTAKQHLGLQDCASTLLETQLDHVSSVLVSYACLQLEMHRRRYDTPEARLRALKRKNYQSLTTRISSLVGNLQQVYA